MIIACKGKQKSQPRKRKCRQNVNSCTFFLKHSLIILIFAPKRRKAGRHRQQFPKLFYSSLLNNITMEKNRFVKPNNQSRASSCDGVASRSNKFVKVLLMLVALLLPTSLQAAGNDLFLTVTTTGGVSTTFYLSENPVITYVNDVLVVTSSEKEVSVPAAQVVDVNLTGLHQLATNMSDVLTKRPTFVSGQALMTGLPAGSTVQLLNVDGQLLATATANVEGEAMLDLKALPRGIVIVRTAKQSFKVTNK